MDGQIRATYLILDYILISKSFQVPKCIIKAWDPRLQQISIATPGFLLSSPIPEGAIATEPVPEGIPKAASPLSQVTRATTSSHIASTKEEEVVDVLDFKDEFEVFNRAWSPEFRILILAPHSAHSINR